MISVITSEEVNAYILEHGITLVDGDQIGARWVANQIALKRAIEKTDVSKVITFHSRVSTAKTFAEASPKGIARYINGFSVFHVNGEQRASVRDDTLGAFRNADKGLITNARCLTEGVDVPAVDMVAFIDPRKSRIDIAQATGRAMRKGEKTNKTVGYIVVPLFLDQKKDETIDDAIQRTDFTEVADVVNAMREQDDMLVDIIRELRESRGRGEVFNPRRFAEVVKVLGPAIRLDALTDAIHAELVERLGSSWDEMYGRLVAYKQQHGNCLVPDRYSKQLARWVFKQRTLRTKGKLDPARIQRLEKVGFSWDPFDDYWEEMFRRLGAYKEHHGDCLVPQSCSDKGLGVWVSIQRTLRTKGKVDPARIQRLEELGFVWDPIGDSWEEMFRRLVAYKQQHRNCLVPDNYLSDRQLGKWVGRQRSLKARSKLDPVRIQRLEELGFVWDPIGDYWEEMFRRLGAYKEHHGDCLVPQSYSDKELGEWVSRQRRLRTKGKLDPARIQRVEELGFVWDPIGDYWEEMFRRLVAYKQQHGDCLVRITHSDKQLAKWVSKQRAIKKNGKLDPARIQRLEKVGFSWDPFDDYWEEMFRRLVGYKQQHGNCLVPRSYSDKELGRWVTLQRVMRKQAKLDPARIQRLEELGFVWDPVGDYWEEMFRRLVAYKEQHGDCLVQRSDMDKHLAIWVAKQRGFRKKGKLDPTRMKRLGKLGFVWDARGEYWECMFGRLVAYKKERGNSLVPRSYSDKQLADWVAQHRVFKNKGKLDPVRVQRLEELGFVWNAKELEGPVQTKSPKRNKERYGKKPQILPSEKQKTVL